MSYDIPVPKVQALSHDTDELNFTDDYADIKGSTIWRNTLATSGLGLTADCPTDNSVLTEHVGELYY